MEVNNVNYRKMILSLVAVALVLTLAPASQAQSCGQFGGFGYGGGRFGNQVAIPAGYGDGIGYPGYQAYGAQGYAPAYANGYGYQGGYGYQDYGRRRHRNRTRNIVLGVAAAALVAHLLSR